MYYINVYMVVILFGKTLRNQKLSHQMIDCDENAQSGLISHEVWGVLCAWW